MRVLSVSSFTVLFTLIANPALAQSISERYREPADRIIQAALADDGAYLKLQELCDGIGNRISGSDNLDRATRWAADTLRADGADNVRLETVMVPKWVRGKESCEMIEPRRQDLPMLGLGYSVGTPPAGITAPVVVVRDEKELEALGTGARGKIVLFNNVMPPYTEERGTSYGTAVRFRSNGARLAAAQGAVGCLIRSVTAHSLRTPHTGMMRYGDAVDRIPAAALTVEDAEMIARLQARGVPVKVTLKMEAQDHGEVPSANVIGELRGTTFPEEIVVIGGHIDSWDVGQGAQDDGGGCVTALEALNLLRKLNLRPKRTIRVVLWTAEEVGLFGGKQYAVEHAAELARHVAAIESDIGSFIPHDYAIDCKDEDRMKVAAGQLGEILKLCSSVAPLAIRTGSSAADVSPMKEAGVVVMGHESNPEHYFDYHHTPADTVAKVDPHELQQNVAVMAVTAYVIADMPQRFGEKPKD
ncbi:MAG TPA: M20/M25/M40 family metallo-hydrolase [Phycisphaerae bacterium]|nr:M20/M25/M40 family metallo-hydrolase [Phycisphaerae bacterium]